MRLLATAILASIPALALAQGTAPDESRLSVPILGTGGSPVGLAEMTDTPNGTLLVATFDADKLPAGEHAIHFHETGDCSDVEKFESAGAHYNPAEAEHGFLPEAGPHAGDLPNVVIVAGEKTEVSLFNAMLRFKEGDAPLLDGDGSALVVHAGPDDYEGQPSGNSGDRLACAEITGN